MKQCNAVFCRAFCIWPLVAISLIYCSVVYGKTSEFVEHNQFANVYKDNLNGMMDMLDEDYAPCEDFFQHACGNFNDSKSIPSFLYNKQDRLRFFDENRSEFKTGAGILLRNLYDSCKHRSQPAMYEKIKVNRIPIPAAAAAGWKLIFKEINDFWPDIYDENLANWPFLRYQWDEMNSTMNWPKLAGHLAAHGIPIFVNIFFAENTIYIGPADIPLCPTEDIITESLMRSVDQITSQMAKVIASELSLFCRQLTGELTISEEQHDDDDVEVDNNVTEYLKIFFGNLNFTETEITEARKIQLDEIRLREILSVIRRTDGRTIINYIIWQLIEALRYEDCYKLTNEFETLLLTEYWQWNVFEPFIKKDVAMATYLFHTTRFQKRRKDRLTTEHWSTFFLENKPPKRDYSIERLIKKYSNSFLAEEVLNTIYDQMHLQSTSAFHVDLMRMRAYKLHQTFYEELIDDEDINHPRYFVRQFFHFIQLIMKQPYYHYYSTHGLELWLQSNFLYNTDGYYTTLDCLEKQTEIYFDEWPIFGLLATERIEEIYKFSQAFGEAYRDYQFWLEGESFSFAEDYVLEYAKMTSKQIMFYAVAQTYCGRNDNIYRTLINRSFMNIDEFQEAFECSTDAPMNPVTKCYFRDC